MSFARTLAAIIPFLLVAQFPVPAEPTAPISVTITLETYEARVSVNTTEGWAAFNGTVALEDPLQRDIDVSLLASGTSGWGVSCSPSILTFSRAGELPFTCNVRITCVGSNTTGTVVIQGMAYWRGEALVSNLSSPLVINVTRLPVQQSPNQTSLHGLDFKKSLENSLPELTVLSVLVAATVVVAVVWTRRRKRKAREPKDLISPENR
jgi:hypothetical protein